MKSQVAQWSALWSTVIVIATAFGVRAQTGGPQAGPAVPWDDRTWEQRTLNATYEDLYTFKHRKTFFLDPYIWAYSQEFATRFRMPAAGVDKGLTGALAVAWRVTTIGQTTCGLGGRADNCWPTLTCQMDVYFDRSVNLPWRYAEPMRDNFMRGLTSVEYLPPLSKESLGLRYTEVGVKGPPLRNTAFRYIDSGTTTFGFLITHFDRSLEGDISLVGFKDACPSIGLDHAATLRFFSEEEFRRTRGAIQHYAHTVEFSRSFMKRIADVYQAQNKPDEDIRRRLIQNFFDSRKGDPNFTSGR